MYNANSLPTLNEFISEHGLHSPTVYRLLELGIFDTDGGGHDDRITLHTADALLALKQSPVLGLRHFYTSDSYFREAAPHLQEYAALHDSFDKLCWLIKFTYSSDADIKQKRFNLARTFQNALLISNIELDRMAKLYGNPRSPDIQLSFLKKAWLDEFYIWKSLPPDYLRVGSAIEPDNWPMDSAEWAIIRSYYVCYQSLASMVAGAVSPFDRKQHKKPYKLMANGGSIRLSAGPLIFPFSLGTSEENWLEMHKRVIWNSAKARMPRHPYHKVYDLAREMDLIFKYEGGFQYFLYNSRVWANYTGVDTLIAMRQGALQAFLQRNLFTIQFFLIGLAELLAIAQHGPAAILIPQQILASDLSKSFGLDYVKARLNPATIRTHIYKALGFCPEDLRTYEPPLTSFYEI